jgi:hypothetical protein
VCGACSYKLEVVLLVLDTGAERRVSNVNGVAIQVDLHVTEVGCILLLYDCC